MKRTPPGATQEFLALSIPHASKTVTIPAFESAAFDPRSANSSILVPLQTEMVTPILWKATTDRKPGIAQESQLLTVEEAAEFLSVPVSTIYHWTSRREIPMVRVGRHLRFEKDVLLQHFKNPEAQGKNGPSPVTAPPSGDVASRLSSLKSKFSRPADRTKKKE